MVLTAVAPAHCQEGDSIGGRDDKARMPEYIQEFFLSEAVRSQDKGELQVTFAADARQRIGTNAALQIEYGLTNRLQISFQTPYGITASQNAEVPARWSTVSVGLLYQIIQRDQPFALSLGMEFGVPVRSTAKWGYEPSILAAKTFRKLQIHASFFSDVEGQKPSLEYNVACVYPVKSRWFPTLEFNGRRLDGKNSFYLKLGLYRHFKHRLEMGIGIPFGIGGVPGSLGVVGKMNWEFGGER
jgi:hypothetical protein